jgi:hypothetical protein
MPSDVVVLTSVITFLGPLVDNKLIISRYRSKITRKHRGTVLLCHQANLYLTQDTRPPLYSDNP